MKNRDTATLSVLRVLCSEMKNEEIEMKAELSDEKVQQLVARQVKQLKDAMQDFAAGGRDDLVAQNKQEIDILSRFLPEQLSDEALLSIVKQVVADAGEKTNVGQIMGVVMKQVQGRAEGNRVREMVQSLL